jgi:hypothetical protein
MTNHMNIENPKRRINWNRGGVLDASIKEQQQVYNTTHLSTKMHRWLECDKVRIGTAARDHPEDGDSSSHSQAVPSRKKNQTKRYKTNTSDVSLTRSGFACATVLHAALMLSVA